MACLSRCGDDPTRWLVLRVEGPPGKHAVSYRCRTCGHTRLQLGGVEDIQSAVARIAETYEKRHGVAYVDREEFQAYLLAEAWTLWLKFKPDKGVPFGAFFFRYLPLRAHQYYRSSLGRNGQKTLVPIGDASDVTRRSVGEHVPPLPGDPAVRGDAPLVGLLAR